MKKIYNIILNTFKGNNLRVITKKLIKRLERSNNFAALKWAKDNVNISTDEFCRKIDENLFQDVKKDIAEIESKGELELSGVDIDLGGGGNYLLLYFLVRKFKPSNVVETGVAAGWTSLAILQALNKNGKGKLYSSDFPYFRLDNPEQYIGILVKDHNLKARWHLDTNGDELNLPRINTLLGDEKIDLFHYDSDKSYSGRDFAFNALKNKFKYNCIIIYDDIQDNFHFKDMVEEANLKYTILEFQDKYLGLIGI